MIRLIFSIIFLIILAVFIVFNAAYTTEVNLFGYKMESVPTVAVVLLTLVVGVLYSFCLYLTSYFSKKQSYKLKNRKQKNEAKAKELESKEKELKTVKEALEKPKVDFLPEPENLSAGVSGSGAPAAPKRKKIR